MADALRESVVTFNILEESLITSDSLLSTLTEEEQNEVQNIVTLLECAEQNSLNDFENEKTAL